MTNRRQQRIKLGLLAAAGLLGALLVSGCAAGVTPTTEPTAPPPATATPSPLQALDGHTYLIQIGEQIYGVETIHAEMSEQGLVVLSEIQRAGMPGVERRTVVLSAALNPLQYTIERVAEGGRSYWLAVREESGISCLASILDWYGPVFHEQLSPLPEVMLESTPSALPYVLLALRFAALDLDPQQSVLRLQAMDILDDLPQSRPLDLAGAPDAESAVIGTVALQGSLDEEPTFTLWFDPNQRVLYSVSIPAARWDLWAARDQPHLGERHEVTIRRVRQAPELPAPATPETARGEAVSIPISDGEALSGWLALPAGQGPFPCIVLTSGGAQPRWETGDALVHLGYATLRYDPRGLGQSDGRPIPGELDALAEDARAVGTWAANDARIAPDAVFLAGIGEGAYVAALALSEESTPYAGAIVAPYSASAGLVELARCQVSGAMASYHGWDRAATDRYLAASLGNWQAWLLEGEPEVSLLGRRLSLRGLRQWSQGDMAALLAASQRPLLYLHVAGSPWACQDEPPALPGATVVSADAELLSQRAPLTEEIAAAWVDWAETIRRSVP